MKKTFFLLLLSLFVPSLNSAKTNYEITSPNGDLQLTVTISDRIYYNISSQNELLLEQGIMQMQIGEETLGSNPKVASKVVKEVNETITPDMTISLASKVGEYAIVAKRKGDKWYIGGMTNNKENERVFELPLDFLTKDRNYKMTSFEDGANANYQAMHYIKNVKTVKKGDTIKVRMARNGGFAAVIE